MKDSNVKLFMTGLVSCALSVLFIFLAIIAFFFSATKNEGKQFIKERADIFTEKVTVCYDLVKDKIDNIAG
ncbi:MAG: hypothetical protein MJ153_02390 [Clostridia bacterium]|nr:hypothetical protein [Clostridia bacterium]